MKLCRNKQITKKIIIVLVTIIVLNFSIPMRSEAVSFAQIGGDLLKELVQLLASVGDVVMGALNHFMLGTEDIISSVMLDQEDENLTSAASSLYGKGEADIERSVSSEDLDGLLWTEWKIPNMLYCPENIFANKIAMLDVNFIRPHTFTPVEYTDASGERPVNATDSSTDKAESLAGKPSINNTIASWYKAFRNIAVVGLLIVLVYLGIRILISSTSADKAKYKESLQDWVVALCLVVIIHFIMSGIMMITEKVTDLLDNTANKTIRVSVTSGASDTEGEDTSASASLQFRTNITGYIRFLAQNEDWGNCTAYTILYLAIVIFTLMFTVTYLKRFLYMAFFTMIAPLVALTYPIDKARDGKAQAFDMWFKEYTMNAIIQPIHLLLYSVFVGSAIDLAVDNPIYAIICMMFLTTAEKFIKKMFGLNKAETTSGLGAIAGGALAMKGIGNLVGKFTGKGAKSVQSGKNDEEETLTKRGKSPRMNSNPLNTIASSMGRTGGAGASVATGAGTVAGAGAALGPLGIVAGATAGAIGAGARAAGGAVANMTGAGDNQTNPQNPLETEQQRQDRESLNAINTERRGLTQMMNSRDATPEEREEGRARLEELARQQEQIEARQAAQRRIELEQSRDMWQSMSEDESESVLNRFNARQEAQRAQQEIDRINGTGDFAPENTQRNQQETNRTDGTRDFSSGNTQSPEPRRVNFTPREQMPRRRTVGTGLSAAGAYVGRRISGAMTTDNIKDKMIKGGKAVARTGLRTAGKVAGTAVAASVIGTASAAAAVTTGDLSSGASILAGGLGMSAAVGGSVGGRIGESTYSRAEDVTSGAYDAYKAGRYTKDEQKEKKQEKYDRQWRRREENYKYLMEKANMTSKEAKEFINDEKTKDFLRHDITDIGIIYNARKLADEKGYDNSRAVASAQMASGLGKDFKDNNTAQNALRENIRGKNTGMDDNDIETLINELAEITDT